jgi:hypothetical protein
VSRKGHSGNDQGTGGPIWGPVSGCKTPQMAEETDPGRWWAPAEVGNHLRMVDLPCHAIPALCKGCSCRGPGKTPSNDIKGRNRRQELHLGSMKILYEALGQELEFVKRAVGIPVGM